MALQKIINNQFSPWMDVVGPETDVVISSRIRLARNLRGLAFPCQNSLKDLQEVYRMISGAIKEKLEEPFHFFSMEEMSTLDRDFLVAKHLISPALALSGIGRACAINEEETITIMINEEDHLRIQALISGLNLGEAWERLNLLDDRLEEELHYAFHENWGYLTTCPTNMGTGLRASVMVHLPGLELTGRTRSILSTITQLGLAVRGLYGEGTDSYGNIFQISNQITLGQKEEEIIHNLFGVTKEIIHQERNARHYLLEKDPDGIKDRVFRAFGLLCHAHRISSSEALKLISDVRLGVDLQLLEDLDPSLLNGLLVTITPSFIHRMAREELPGKTRDIKRASLIKKQIGH